MGAGHGLDLYFLFGKGGISADVWPGGPDERKISRALKESVASFARCGDPNGPPPPLPPPLTSLQMADARIAAAKKAEEAKAAAEDAAAEDAVSSENGRSSQTDLLQ